MCNAGMGPTMAFRNEVQKGGEAYASPGMPPAVGSSTRVESRTLWVTACPELNPAMSSA